MNARCLKRTLNVYLYMQIKIVKIVRGKKQNIEGSNLTTVLIVAHNNTNVNLKDLCHVIVQMIQICACVSEC